VADDIGEALDFVVGLAKVGGASRNCASALSRARAERRTRKIEMPASAITRPEPAMVTAEAMR
jgi:hypothetical protein